ncbi:hypothetical protein [Micromonospora tulbaghiae]|uniref:hypothetical protein n=1 Tax=Micromonospora tulbaghiae TaxID=479978 RepID=UPI0036AB875B
MNRRALLRTAALTGLAAATGLAATSHGAAAAESVNGPWLVSVGWGVLQVDPGRTTSRELLPNGDHAKTSPDGRYVAWVNPARSGDGTLAPFVAVYDGPPARSAPCSPTRSASTTARRPGPRTGGRSRWSPARTTTG